PCRTRGAAGTQRAQEPVGRDGRGAEDLRQPSVPDPPLKFHLPQAILSVRVPEPEVRVELRLAEDVRHGIGVADDVDRRRQPGDRDRAIELRQRAPEVTVCAERDHAEQDRDDEEGFRQKTTHERMILKRQTAESMSKLLKAELDRLYDS